MDERSQRILNAIEKSGYSYPELSQVTGISKSSLQRYATGETKKIPIDCIEKIAQATGCSAKYLMGWEDEENTTNAKAESITFLDSNNICMIPLYETVSAGFGEYADSTRVGFIPMYIETQYDAENMLAIKVKGDSMYPKIEDGDTIVVRKQSDFDNGDIVVVLIDGDEGLVKKIVQDKNKITLISINPEYQDRVYTNSEIERLTIVGVVKKIIKEV